MLSLLSVSMCMCACVCVCVCESLCKSVRQTDASSSAAAGMRIVHCG